MAAAPPAAARRRRQSAGFPFTIVEVEHRSGVEVNLREYVLRKWREQAGKSDALYLTVNIELPIGENGSNVAHPVELTVDNDTVDVQLKSTNEETVCLRLVISEWQTQCPSSLVDSLYSQGCRREGMHVRGSQLLDLVDRINFYFGVALVTLLDTSVVALCHGSTNFAVLRLLHTGKSYYQEHGYLPHLPHGLPESSELKRLSLASPFSCRDILQLYYRSRSERRMVQQLAEVDRQLWRLDLRQFVPIKDAISVISIWHVTEHSDLSLPDVGYGAEEIKFELSDLQDKLRTWQRLAPKLDEMIQRSAGDIRVILRLLDLKRNNPTACKMYHILLTVTPLGRLARKIVSEYCESVVKYY